MPSPSGPRGTGQWRAGRRKGLPDALWDTAAVHNACWWCPPPTNSPHEPCHARMPLCFPCLAVQKPLAPPRVSSFAPRSARATWRFMRSTAVQLRFNDREFMFVPPLIFHSLSRMHWFCILCIITRTFTAKRITNGPLFLSSFPPYSALLLVTFSTWINVVSSQKQACGIYSGKVLILKLGHFPLAINSEQ